MKSNKKDYRVVYSTNPDYVFENETQEIPIVSPEHQTLYISLDKKQRKGKKVTLISGFQGPEEALKQLGKDLKVLCGIGGSAKNGEILLQGDFRLQVKSYLEKLKFKVTLSGG